MPVNEIKGILYPSVLVFISGSGVGHFFKPQEFADGRFGVGIDQIPGFHQFDIVEEDLFDFFLAVLEFGEAVEEIEVQGVGPVQQGFASDGGEDLDVFVARIDGKDGGDEPELGVHPHEGGGIELAVFPFQFEVFEVEQKIVEFVVEPVYEEGDAAFDRGNTGAEEIIQFEDLM